MSSEDETTVCLVGNRGTRHDIAGNVGPSWRANEVMKKTIAVQICRKQKGGPFVSVVAGIALLVAGCSGGGSGNSGPTVSLSASPNPVNSGQSTTISWSAPNATSCTASGDWSGQGLPPSGSAVVGGVTSAKTYILTCTGSAGSGTGSVTVTINQPPVAANACFSILDNQSSVTGNLPASDPNGSNLTYQIVDQPAGGSSSVSTTPVGVFTYTPPNAGSTAFRGMNKFTFQATDPGGLVSQKGTVTILNHGTVHIMPVGDSITEGVEMGDSCTGTSDNNCPLDAERIAFRKTLIQNLQGLSSGYSVHLVGSLTNGSAAGLLAPDDHHEGHPGWTANEILNGTMDPTKLALEQSLDPDCPDCKITDWLNLARPDIVLLHIGTNGINLPGGTSSTDVAGILDAINAWGTSNFPVTVFLAQIIGSPNTTTNGNITTFDGNLVTMAKARPEFGKRLFLVDQLTGANLIYTIDTSANCLDPTKAICSGDMGDDLHPNPSGYNKMAAKWQADLQSARALPSCQ
jgi:Bacterial Ig domain/GDSL-like Lipase/Acylhydrolase